MVGDVGQPLELDGLDEAQLVVEYPLLFALLSCLIRTSVITLVISSYALTSRRYKWTRSSRDEPFQLVQ